MQHRSQILAISIIKSMCDLKIKPTEIRYTISIAYA